MPNCANVGPGPWALCAERSSTSPPLPNGYAYVFEATSEILSQLARLVDLERQCCAFLTFRIVVEAGLQPICIEITGPPEAKAIIADFFGS